MGRLLVAACGLAIVACGRVGFDDLADGGPADPDATPAFSMPMFVIDDPTRLVTNPAVREDELEMFVVMRDAVNQQGDVYVTQRVDALAPWGQLTLVPELSGTGDEAGLHIGRTGLVMWFASIRAGGVGMHDIYRSTRPSFGAPWTTPAHVMDVSSPATESSPATDATEVALVLNVGSGPRHLARSARTPGSEWPAPQPVSELEMFDESGPALTPNGLTMYFAADRTGVGTTDLYVTQRATTTSPFATPTRLDEVSSSAVDSVPWISATENVLYFVSDRTGRPAIYRAERR